MESCAVRPAGGGKRQYRQLEFRSDHQRRRSKIGTVGNEVQLLSRLPVKIL